MKNGFNNFTVTVTDDFNHIPFAGKIRLLFVLTGNISVRTADGSFDMKAEDFLLINKNRSCFVDQSSGYLLAVIDIDYYMICRVTGKSAVAFQCNSALDNGVKYEKFRYIIGQFLNEYAVENEAATFAGLSGFYRLCGYMVRYFMISEQPALTTRDRNKIENVLLYLEENWNRKVSLEEISRYCYMTPTSFSRYFHRETGITYVSYINQLKLNYAEEALLHGDQTITEIALNAGFPSVPGFNRLFKKVYGVSPREYRQKNAQQEKENLEKLSQVFEHSLEKYRNRTRLTVVKEQKIRDIRIRADAKVREEAANPWKGMVHFGSAAGLLSAEYQKQIKILKEDLGIEFGCINGLFAKELKIWENHKTEELNFSYLDNILDCLVDNRICPVISFDDQLRSLIKNINPLAEPEYDVIFTSPEECLGVISRLIRHLMYRYGADEVDNWMFDLWYNEFTGRTLSLSQPYFMLWDQIYDCIRSLLPRARIGGSGTGPSVGYKRQLDFYKNWKKAHHRPDFISINSYPYRQSDNRKVIETIRRKVDHFFIEDLEDLRKVLTDACFPEAPIMVLQWNLSFVQRNFFNDTSAKAAVMLTQMTGKTEEIERVSYYVASDLYAGDFDTPAILNGATGLLSKDGIRKPAFYALQFMGQVLKYVIRREENCLITTDGRGHIAVLLFNNKTLNYNYYAKQEAEITLDIVDDLYLERDVLEISLTIENVKNGKYYIHKQLIGPEHGDVLNEWRQLGVETPLRMNDIEYLRSRCVPFRKNDCVSVDDHQLKLWERLKEHEIMLLNIDYIME